MVTTNFKSKNPQKTMNEKNPLKELRAAYQDYFFYSIHAYNSNSGGGACFAGLGKKLLTRIWRTIYIPHQGKERTNLTKKNSNFNSPLTLHQKSIRQWSFTKH